MRTTPLLVLLMMLASCAGSRPQSVDYARPFPPALEQASVLEIQVRRTPTTVTFTNTTAQDIPACTMWLNKRYSRPIDAVPVAASVTFPLASFVDEFGEGFRPGGFWATRPSQRVVLVQFEVPAEAGVGTPDSTAATRLVGAVVVDGEEDPDARRRRANPF